MGGTSEWSDRLMELLAVRHPLYRWEHNKGYSTAEHLAALGAHGLTAHHRLTFQPVTQLPSPFRDQGAANVSDHERRM